MGLFGFGKKRQEREAAQRGFFLSQESWREEYRPEADYYGLDIDEYATLAEYQSAAEEAREQEEKENQEEQEEDRLWRKEERLKRERDEQFLWNMTVGSMLLNRREEDEEEEWDSGRYKSSLYDDDAEEWEENFRDGLFERFSDDCDDDDFFGDRSDDDNDFGSEYENDFENEGFGGFMDDW